MKHTCYYHNIISTSTRCKSSNPYKVIFHEKLLIGKVYLYTQVQRQRNERDPNKNNKGKIMEGKILMRGKNTQYISEEIDVSCLEVSVKNH